MIKTLRQALNITQKQLAEKAGIKTAMSISSIETGKKTTPKMLKKIADALGVDISLLLYHYRNNEYGNGYLALMPKEQEITDLVLLLKTTEDKIKSLLGGKNVKKKKPTSNQISD